jgi:hypothetical protein
MHERHRKRRTGSLLSLSDMPVARGYLLVPHESDCEGFWMVVERGGRAEIKFNSCGEVIDTVAIERAGSRLMELAGAEMMCSARCPHCGSLNSFPGFNAIEAFVCQECGEGVNVERPV